LIPKQQSQENWDNDERKLFVNADKWQQRKKNQDDNTKKINELRMNLNKISVEN